MMTTKKLNMLDEFKKSYILKKTNEIAQDYEFIKGFTLNIMSEYMRLLSEFLKKNKIKLDNFIDEIKDGKKLDKNNRFLKDLNFIFIIPNLIKIHNNEIEIDYVFLEKNFSKIEKKQKITELKNSLNELEQEFKLNNSSFNLSDLYKFGEFILNFLTKSEIREKIVQELLKDELESNNKFEKEFNQQFIQKQKNINTWNSIQSIRA